MYDHVIWAGGDSSDSHRTSIAPRIDFEGAALFALFLSAKGAGLDAALATLSVRPVAHNMLTTLTCTLKESQ
jgi:hypothetical protein